MTTWRYSVTVGLMGGYLPNSVYGPYSGTTRSGLRDMIQTEMQQLDIPAYRFREVGIKRLWRYIKTHGGSDTAHFSIEFGNNEILVFHGLTRDEFKKLDVEDM